MKTLREEVMDSWMSPDLLFYEDPTTKSLGGNTAHALGLFYTLLVLRREATVEDGKNFSQAMAALVVRDTAKDPTPGLYWRSQSHTMGLNSHDNYMGTALGSYFLGTLHARYIYGYGSRFHWYFDEENPREYRRLFPLSEFFRPWHSRFGWVVPFYKMAAGKELTWFDRKMVKLKLFMDRHNYDDDSAKILTWMIVQVAKSKGVFTSEVKTWERHICDVYGDFSVVLTNYFGVTHPFVRYFPG